MKRTAALLVLAQTAPALLSACSSDSRNPPASPTETVTVTATVTPTQSVDEYAGAAEPCKQAATLTTRASRRLSALTQQSDAVSFLMDLARDYREVAEGTASVLGPGSARVGGLTTQVAKDADDAALGFLGILAGTTSREYVAVLVKQLSDDMGELRTYCNEVRANN